MGPKHAAIEEDVTSTPAEGWEVLVQQTETFDILTVAGEPVAKGAMTSFTSKDGTDNATLTPSPAILRVGGQNIVRSGDTAEGVNVSANQIEVEDEGRPLRSE